MAQETAYRKYIQDKAREFCIREGFNPSSREGKSIIGAFLKAYGMGQEMNKIREI